MWTVRRAVNPLSRSQGYLFGGVSRVCSAKSVIDFVGTCHPPNFTYNTFISLPNTFYQHSYTSNLKYSSQAGPETSEDDDNLEDGFSELEIPPTQHNTVTDENDELVSEPELSDDDHPDDILDEASQVDIDLSDSEKNVTPDAKRRTTTEFFKIIMAAPRQSFDDTLNKWVQKGNYFGRSEISLAMLNLRKRRMYGKALQLSEWLEANKHLEFVERDYASRLDLIYKVRGLHRAEKYIESIPQSFRGEVIYRNLLANCVNATNMKKAEEVFNKMRDLKFQITAFACNQLLLLYKRLDKKKIADVLLFMEKENIKPSLFTFRLLIDTKGQSHDITGMEQLLETMKEQGFEPDVQTQSMIARHYITGGLNGKAETIVKDMEGSDLQENRGACRALLPLYADLNKADEVRRVWDVCKSNPRVDECLAAIEAWGKLGRIEDAEAVFDRMTQTWKKLSARNYTTLLKVYANHKMLAKGKDIAKRMSDSGCHIGPWTWDALVRLYVEAGEVEKADLILQKAAQQNKMKPLFNSFITIMDQYAKRGDIHNAEKIFHRLKQCGYVGRVRQYQALLQAYINAKAPAYGFRDRMKADNVFPNKVVASQLAQVDAFKKTAISDLLD